MNKDDFESVIVPSDYVKVLFGSVDFDDTFWGSFDDKVIDVPIVRVNAVLFPHIYAGVPIANRKSIELIKTSYENERFIGVVSADSAGNTFKIGTLARIMKIVEMPNGFLQVMIQGGKRMKILSYNDDKTLAKIEVICEPVVDKTKDTYKATLQAVKSSVIKLFDLLLNVPKEIRDFIDNNFDCDIVSFLTVSSMNIENAEKQKVLEAPDYTKRGDILIKILTREAKVLELKNKILMKAQKSISQAQEEYLLKQQMKACSEELGSSINSDDSEVNRLYKKGKRKKWNASTARFFDKIIEKASKMNQNNADYTILISQAELMLDLPWKTIENEKIDIKNASDILNESHFKMDKVKERILDYLAVFKLKKGNKIGGQILCFVGPPGVGKTSLCKSIAKALGRDYVKVALGGVHDEAEIRGHRKTYIGAMPGRIIKGMQGLKNSNPVVLLDEIDKMSNTSCGDPSAALLEVLDPDQNDSFVDNYLETPYDLSNVMFIATANTLDHVPRPLLDRLEVIEVPGYAMEEKCEIAKRYIIPEQKAENGIKDSQMQISDESLIKIIDDYTRESGVRELKRQIATVSRKIARKIVEKNKYNKVLDVDDVESYLGIKKYDRDYAKHISIPGVAIGLAWTPVGGDILFIESSLVPGTGKLTLSGKIGDIMRESAMIAFTYVKSHAQEWNINSEVFGACDLHIHVPDGATPKDGPSAGITLFTTLLSLYTKRKVKDNLAMTGELTLRGDITAVGGIREKVLAAKRAGIKNIIMCEDNEKDVEEIDKDYISDISFNYVRNVNEVVPLAIENQKIEECNELKIFNVL